MTRVNRNAMVRQIREGDDADTFIFPLSSELPYRRWDGNEILVHDADSVDLSFLNSGTAPLLDAHDRYTGLAAQIGVIVRAWLENKRVYVEARFSRKSHAQDVKQDVIDGIVQNVSVGYDIQKIERNEDDDEYRVTKWKPMEASFVPIPADASVGMGRSATITGGNMPEEIRTLPPAVVPVATTNDAAERGAAIAEAMTEINALGAIHNMRDQASAHIEAAVRAGEVPSLARFVGIVRAAIPADTPLRNEDIGLTTQESRQFSILALARSMLEDASRSDIAAASFEREACAAAREVAGPSSGGEFRLPAELMRHWNDFEVDGMSSRAALGTANPAGNANVLTIDHLAASFIENLRNQMTVTRAGATILSGLTSNIEIPGGDTNAAVTWESAEDASAAETGFTFRKVSMSMKTASAYIDLTRKFLMQSTIALEAYTRMQLLEGMASAIDLAGLQGSGAAGQPTGLKNVAGVASINFAGATPTRSEIIDIRTSIASTNVGRGVTFLGNSDMVGRMQKTLVDAGSGQFLMNDDATRLIGNPYQESNAISNSTLVAGIFSDMLMGLWGSLELSRSTERKLLTGGLTLVVRQSVDFGVRRVGSFVYADNVV